MADYDPNTIEAKWQKEWIKEAAYEPDLDGAKRPFYNLMMFPYPSAEGLHVGNMYAFTGADIYGRMKRMQGYDVFEPIGLDGFGIHSENYALKIGAHPMDQAKKSEERFYKQLQSIGNGFAWNEHLETYDPEYYRWTQWIFVQMFKKGLAYRKKQQVNWCPKDQTVLADEQVEAGKCERCGTEVIKKELEQWFFKITDYAGRLLDNLEKLDWSEKVKIAQKNWIGRSEGALIKFPLKNVPGQKDGAHSVEVFTTRPDTLFGATFIVISPELAKKWMDVGWGASPEVKKYVETSLKRTEIDRVAEGKEKTGVETGLLGVNPVNNEEIPVWVADYVLGSYGTGAIMAVPAHDERDFEFAAKFKLPVRNVIEPETGEHLPKEEHRSSIVAIVEDPKTKKFLTLNWGPKLGGTLFIGGGREKGEDEVTTALREIKEETGYTKVKFIGKTGRMHHHYFAFSKNVARNIEVVGLHFKLEDHAQEEKKLEDDEKENFEIEWLTQEEVLRRMEDENHVLAFRQLVMGEVYSGRGILADSGKFTGMDSEDAKWEIAKLAGGEQKTQFRLRDWLISRQRYWGPPIPMIHCAACAAAKKGERSDAPGWYSVPEADLPVILPHIKDFRPSGTGLSPLASEKSFYEVKCPGCGAGARRETDVSDTFLDSAWYYLRYLDPSNEKSALNEKRVKKWFGGDRLYTGGAEHSVLHLLYVRFVTMVLHDLKLVDFDEPFPKFRAHGLIIKDGAKMSKSKGNVINPDEYIKNFGADTLRMYLMFLAPFEQGGDFRDQAVLGIERFLKRVWQFEPKPPEKSGKGTAARTLQITIKKITEDIERLHYNTAISALMILFRAFEDEGCTKEEFGTFLKLLAPFAPHIAEELWRGELRNKKTIHHEAWPVFDAALAVESTVTIVLQVNGKVRDTVAVGAGISEADAKDLALNNAKVKVSLGGAAPKRIIYVPNKLVNIVI